MDMHYPRKAKDRRQEIYKDIQKPHDVIHSRFCNCREIMPRKSSNNIDTGGGALVTSAIIW